MNLLLIKYLLKISTNKFVKGIAQCQTDLKNFFLARRFLVKCLSTKLLSPVINRFQKY